MEDKFVSISFSLSLKGRGPDQKLEKVSQWSKIFRNRSCCLRSCAVTYNNSTLDFTIVLVFVEISFLLTLDTVFRKYLGLIKQTLVFTFVTKVHLSRQS